MLFLLIEGLDDTFPDAGVFVETEDKSRKYLTFLFNNPNRYDQPFYMTLNPKTFECYEKRNGENIILKQKGYKVYITAKGGRIVSGWLCRKTRRRTSSGWSSWEICWR